MYFRSVETGTAANLASSNPKMLAGVLYVETDTGVSKVGDGSTLYNDGAVFVGRMQVEVGSGAPGGTPVDGALYLDQAASPQRLYIAAGGVWVGYVELTATGA